MVLPISGFLPVPLPMMIPFMGAQSLVIGKMFGEGFQYGKRKISAMPNEEFNKLTFEAMMSNARDEMQASIPTMQKALQDMKPMVETVVHEFTNYLSLVIEKAPQQLAQIKTSIEDVSGFTELNAKLVKLIAEAKGTSQSQDVLGDILVALGLERFGQSAGAVDMTSAGSTSFPLTDTSGMSLAQHEANKKAEHARLIAAKANRPKQIQEFDSTKILPQVSRDVTKRKAGQSAKLQRSRLIQNISKLGKLISSRAGDKRKRDGRIKILKQEQQRLVNLLARYRF